MDYDYIGSLREAIQAQSKHHEPWATGVHELADSEKPLFFTCKDGSARLFQVGSMTDADVATLVHACDPASFGRGMESVLDDTNSKTWKLDDGDFVWRFNPDSAHFISQLARRLCPWDEIDKGIRVEPDKLNVYEKGSSSTVHQDAPHAENAFGTLVVTLPIYHQGGNLVLRRRTRELDFHAPALLQSASPTSVAWVAFYSDVEHEVLEVADGTQITVTYSLYFDPRRSAPILPEAKEFNIPENPFTAALRHCFRDAAFIRNYKYLAFGMEYQYPKDADDYWNIIDDLKGPDAFLYRVLTQVGLDPRVRFLYHWGAEGACGFWALLSSRVDGRVARHVGIALADLPESELDHLFQEDKEPLLVWKPGNSEAKAEDMDHSWVDSYFSEDLSFYRSRTVDVHWVTNPTANMAGYTGYDEDENEYSQENFYYSACIVIDASKVACPPFAPL